ncbi:MAG: DNA polymerase III subunit chi [Gammaproteobacteria bacterium]|nr:DNA polymerase III subunit chi [Gammaproteobacteria bacterium]
MIIEFYVLDVEASPRGWVKLCNLIENFYKSHDTLFILQDDEHAVEQLDRLLWTYKDDSFIPHQRYKLDDVNPAPIQLGVQLPPGKEQGTFINLTLAVPASYQTYSKVIEIVFEDPANKKAARIRYRQYLQDNCKISTQTIKTNY